MLIVCASNFDDGITKQMWTDNFMHDLFSLD